MVEAAAPGDEGAGRQIESGDTIFGFIARIWGNPTSSPATLTVEPPPPGTDRNPPLINAATSGLSVVTSSGAFTTTNVDIAIPGRGPTPFLSRTYNSNDTRSGPLGPGWTHSYNMRVVDPGDGSGAVIVVGPQGRSDRYTPGIGGAFDAPPGVFSTLFREAGGSYTLKKSDQAVVAFDSSKADRTLWVHPAEGGALKVSF